MSQRRSKLQLLVEVLSNIKQGERKPTRLMYASNLSGKILKEILESLVNKGLVNEIIFSNIGNRAKKRYEITPKGESVLQYYCVVKDLITI